MAARTLILVNPPSRFKEFTYLLNDYEVIVVDGGAVKNLNGEVLAELTGNFVKDLIVMVKFLKGLGSDVTLVIGSGDSYAAILTFSAVTSLNDRVRDVLVSRGGEVVSLRTSVTYSLGHGKVLELRLKVIDELSRRGCLALEELSSMLGISRETLLRHLYSLSKSGIVRFEGGSTRVCLGDLAR